MAEFSPAYHRALTEAQQHHASNKTYSGKFLRPHAPFVRELIEATGAQSILDYGCGKGRQYEWISHGEDASIPKGMTIEGYWGVPVTKFDPAYPPFAARPDRQFDLVICTHVLGSIPLADLPTVIEEIYDYAKHGVYIAEKLGPVQKQVFSEPDTFPRGWTRARWEQALRSVLRSPNLTVWLCTRKRTDRGVIVDRRAL